MKKHFLLASVLLPAVMLFAQQSGGMWIPTELNEKEMKSLGMKISAKHIFDTNRPSIKDAVVQFDGGCTAEIISPQGLLLTNHHCGYDNVQSHSTVQNNLLKNGFWAKNMEQELPNPGVTVDFIDDIREVTDKILAGTENLSDAEAKPIIDRNTELLKEELKFQITPHQKIVVKPMYNGNKYYLYLITTYKDVRLVGTPPESIGKFGSDTDNWVWPRHTGDFMLFRVYADKDNNPAEYSKDNVPIKPKHFLPISIKDLKEDDFTFVFGFPGRTNEYLPSIAVEKIVNELNPARIEVRDAALAILNEKMRSDEATKIKYAAKYASISNAWKKWIGESKGLKKSNAVEKKKSYEQSLIQKNAEVKPTIDQLNKLYNEQAPYALTNAYYTEVVRNAETFRLANNYLSFIRLYESGKWTDETQKKFTEMLSNFYKDYDGELDAKVTGKLLNIYVNKAPQEFLPKVVSSVNSKLISDFKNINASLNTIEDWSKKSIITGRAAFNGSTVYTNINNVFSDPTELIKALEQDPLMQIFSSLRESYIKSADFKYDEYQQKINTLQKKYMAQQMETDKEKKFFPDANSTLRVTYGKVKGSDPSDAITYSYQTTLDGVIEKYVPGDYEFDVPQKLINLYNSKDYGIYANKNGKVPVAFTATNHTTGGNSGSPALDAYGNLIGLNFDRQWEGTMSDINYDPKLCRNIMVSSKYILFIIDKFANSKWLLDEMEIVK